MEVPNLDEKPVPLPRRTVPKGPLVITLPLVPARNLPNKPVPLPRKLQPQLNTPTPPVPDPMSTSTTPSFSHPSSPVSPVSNLTPPSDQQEDTLDYSKIPGVPQKPQGPPGKRRTINIFKLAGQISDPFDTEFESSLQEAEVLSLSNISFSSPFNLNNELRESYCSKESSSADDSDHYMEPPPARPVSAELAANLSASRREVPRPRSPRSKGDGDFGRKLVVGKVLSCPVNVEDDDSLYEPVSTSTYSSETDDSGSSGGGGRGNFDPIPSNTNFAQMKRATVPDIGTKYGDKNGSPSTCPRMDRFVENKTKFDATAYDISDLQPGSKVSKALGLGFFSLGQSSRKSIASPTESTDSFIGLFGHNDDDNDNDTLTSKLRRSSSNRSNSNSNSTLNSNTEVKEVRGQAVEKKVKKVHEYDEVAMEEGNVILLDNLNLSHGPKCHSLTSATSGTSGSGSDASNNNINNPNSTSSSSLTSRNSVIAEFDPLLTPTAPTTTTDWGKEEDSEVIHVNLNQLDLNDEQQHRYEYIDTDLEDSPTNDLDLNLDLNATAVDNPEYFPTEQEPFKVDFKANFRKPFAPPSLDEQYEPIHLPQSDSDSKDSTDSTDSTDSKGPTLPPKPSPPSPKSPQEPEVTEVSTSTTNPQEGSSSSSSLVNQSGFFRRFSSKFRLNSIKEEVPSPSLGGRCPRCSGSHPESSRCRFSPPYRDDVVFSTNLYKPGGIGRKDLVKRRVVLAKGKLAFYNEKSDVVSEVLLEKVGVIFKREDFRVNAAFPLLKYFELGLVHSKQSSMVLAGSEEGERAGWMMKYVQAHTSAFPLRVTTAFERGGWCFVKETVTSDWRPGWLVLKERSLFYAYHEGSECFEMDLRKARSIDLGAKESEQRCAFVENHDVLTIDLICKILYIQTDSTKITSGWEKAIKAAASFNGTHFHEMQLTLDSIPVIVDKCIDFLYAHGTLAEGIYRQSGSNTRITSLLSEFQKDAWAVQISHKDYSAHDVAGTLKRFFRTLPEPLVTSELYDKWIKAASMTSTVAKEEVYRSLLEQLPPINYNIMKKLICHLYAVHELNEKNLMPLINLAPIWGPTLMSVDSSKSVQSYETACAECEVVKELIEKYYTLFRVNPEEIAREKKMQDALENFHLGSCRRKHSGDMKIWIYLWQPDETEAINVTLTPYTAAHEVVKQICSKSQVRNMDNISLHEVICGHQLERPLHPSEKVIETVLRWSIWDVEDRKNNFLILKKNSLYPALLHYAKDPRMVVGEFKYADPKTKTFRKCTFQFKQATLMCFKDPKATTELGSWKMDDIVWYIGAETKRTAPTKWPFTFVKKNYPFKRSKEEPFFGHVVCCGSEEELHKWVGAMVIGEHPEGLYPNVIV